MNCLTVVFKFTVSKNPQDAHCPWFLTRVTRPCFLQSRVSGVSTAFPLISAGFDNTELGGGLRIPNFFWKYSSSLRSENWFNPRLKLFPFCELWAFICFKAEETIFMRNLSSSRVAYSLANCVCVNKFLRSV